MSDEPDKLKAASDALAGLTGRTRRAMLEPLMPEIDRKIRSGIQHEEILGALETAGISISLETFRKHLYRYRKRNQAGEKKLAPSTPAIKADGNLPVGNESAGDPLALAEDSQFDDALDPKKRDEIGNRYLAKPKPLFKKNRSEQ